MNDPLQANAGHVIEVEEAIGKHSQAEQDRAGGSEEESADVDATSGFGGDGAEGGQGEVLEG